MEEFYMVLEDPSGDCVLADPFSSSIKINANDEPNGILSLQTTDGLLFPTVIVNEDIQHETTEFVVIRNGGRFGIVTVRWELVRNDTGSENVERDVNPAAGTVMLLNDQRSVPIILNIMPDTEQEATERFYIKLLPGIQSYNIIDNSRGSATQSCDCDKIILFQLTFTK